MTKQLFFAVCLAFGMNASAQTYFQAFDAPTEGKAYTFTTVEKNGEQILVIGGVFNSVEGVENSQNLFYLDSGDKYIGLGTISADTIFVITSMNGDLIAGTDNGVYKFDGNVWNNLFDSEGLVCRVVYYNSGRDELTYALEEHNNLCGAIARFYSSVGEGTPILLTEKWAITTGYTEDTNHGFIQTGVYPEAQGCESHYLDILNLETKEIIDYSDPIYPPNDDFYSMSGGYGGGVTLGDTLVVMVVTKTGTAAEATLLTFNGTDWKEHPEIEYDGVPKIIDGELYSGAAHVTFDIEGNMSLEPTIVVGDECMLNCFIAKYNNTWYMISPDFSYPLGIGPVTTDFGDFYEYVVENQTYFSSPFAKINLGTGVNEVEPDQINFTPNPAKDNISVSEIHSLTIFDLSGEKILSVEHPNTINIQDFPSGIYFAIGETYDNKQISGKFVVE